jgi:hypothetical protein
MYKISFKKMIFIVFCQKRLFFVKNACFLSKTLVFCQKRLFFVKFVENFFIQELLASVQLLKKYLGRFLQISQYWNAMVFKMMPWPYTAVNYLSNSCCLYNLLYSTLFKKFNLNLWFWSGGVPWALAAAESWVLQRTVSPLSLRKPKRLFVNTLPGGKTPG